MSLSSLSVLSPARITRGQGRHDGWRCSHRRLTLLSPSAGAAAKGRGRCYRMASRLPDSAVDMTAVLKCVEPVLPSAAGAAPTGGSRCSLGPSVVLPANAASPRGCRILKWTWRRCSSGWTRCFHRRPVLFPQAALGAPLVGRLCCRRMLQAPAAGAAIHHGAASTFRRCIHVRAPELQSSTVCAASAFRRSLHRLDPELQATTAGVANAFRGSFHRPALELQATSGAAAVLQALLLYADAERRRWQPLLLRVAPPWSTTASRRSGCCKRIRRPGLPTTGFSGDIRDRLSGDDRGSLEERRRHGVGES